RAEPHHTADSQGGHGMRTRKESGSTTLVAPRHAPATPPRPYRPASPASAGSPRPGLPRSRPPPIKPSCRSPREGSDGPRAALPIPLFETGGAARAGFPVEERVAERYDSVHDPDVRALPFGAQTSTDALGEIAAEPVQLLVGAQFNPQLDLVSV